MVGPVGDIALGVAAQTAGADLPQPFEDLARARSVHAEVARTDDRLGAALRAQILETRVEPAHVAVDIGENRDPHGVSHA